MNKVREAVDTLGGAAGICRHLGLKFERDFPCPWREDRAAKMRWNPIAKGKERWHDFKSGENGDEVDFYARVKGIDNRQACKELIKMSGLDGSGGGQRYPKPLSRKPRRELGYTKCESRERPQWPALRRAEPDEVETISELRGLPWQAVEMVTDLGILKIGKQWGYPCWFYVDDCRWNIRYRRLDGQPFRHAKAMAVANSFAAWPIGIDRVRSARRVLVVEGEGDGLAAWASVWAEDCVDEVAVCVMSGAAVSIPQRCLHTFEKKEVRIIPHAGDKGRVGELAALRWGRQLESAGAVVDIYQLVKGDLGDRLDGKSSDEIRGLKIASDFGEQAWPAGLNRFAD
ncbi:hypothetical protein JIN77_11390 [Verrucomicrobiaceae bacterium R5-34]|nr:hypothetical protein [Verrucomicrobiaceae bacterium R5-34]